MRRGYCGAQHGGWSHTQKASRTMQEKSKDKARKDDGERKSMLGSVFLNLKIISHSEIKILSGISMHSP
jgi:hypothetical protein